LICRTSLGACAHGDSQNFRKSEISLKTGPIKSMRHNHRHQRIEPKTMRIRNLEHSARLLRRYC